MRTRRFAPALAALVGALLFPPAGQAEILTFVFEGTVSGLATEPPGLPDFAQMYDPVRFGFTFDTTAPNGSGVPWAAGYMGISAGLRVGENDYVCSPPAMIIQHPLDLFRLDVDLVPSVVDEWLGGSTYFALADQQESNALQSVALPLVPYALEPFAQAQFSVVLWGPPKWGGGYDSIYRAYGQITAFYAIPEPATLVLMGLGGLGIIARRFRRLSL